MIHAHLLFHDPKGIKRLLSFGQIEPLVYKKQMTDLDYLNEQHKQWHCPSTGEEAFTTSIWDMWDTALEDGAQVLQEAVLILQNGASAAESDYSRLIEKLGDRSYETGKPCSSGLEITFVNPMI